MKPWKRRFDPRNFESSTAVPFPKKLNIGCGYDKRVGYLNVDIDPNCTPDLLLGQDGDLGALPKRHFEEILARDVLEHFPRSESLRNLLIWNELLQLNGELRIVTSDILAVATKMTET
jgi:predicted SAM-dependent methyltransferase